MKRNMAIEAIMDWDGSKCIICSSSPLYPGGAWCALHDALYLKAVNVDQDIDTFIETESIKFYYQYKTELLGQKWTNLESTLGTNS